MSALASSLPRLIYVSDVPVESSYHGSALLYRLLQDYPMEKLRIFESNLLPSQPERRLTGVTYAHLPVGRTRPLRTRFARCYSSWLTLNSRSQRHQIANALDGFRPEAVLTVAHGYLWNGAAQFATDQHLPLHLICHDDWPRFANVFPFLKRRVDQRLGEVYRQAVSRLCVSPVMREAYQARYGVPGEVLYPSRATDAPSHAAPPARLREPLRSLTVAFGGTINSRGYVLALRLLAKSLATLGGRLLIFGPFTVADARREGLDLPNVECRGMLSSTALLERFREEVDVLFVPMSFEPQDRPNMEISFPSKLTDYTAVGLPLLIYGPEYSSAVRWARENPGVAEVVVTRGENAIREALQRLATQSAHRLSLAQQALEVGQRYFSPAAAQRVFHGALLGHSVLPAEAARVPFIV